MPRALPLLLCAALLVAAPALAAMQGLPRRTFLDDLSSGLAMAGFAAMLAEFVLSERFRRVSRRVGTDVAMRFRQLLARISLGLVPLRAFLYTLPILHAPPPRDPTAAGWLRLGGRSVATGAVAWVGLAALVVIGIGRDRAGWRYESWRRALGLGAIGALAATAAATLLWVWLLAPALRLRVAPHPFGPAVNPFSIGAAAAAGGLVAFLIREAGDFTAGVGLARCSARCARCAPRATRGPCGWSAATVERDRSAGARSWRASCRRPRG